MDKDKQEFLNEFGHLYGYPNGPKSIDQIRSTEFKRLGDLVYLDHAGATLYSELQMEAVFKDLTTGVYGNPHSQSDSSNASCDVIREARQQVLEYFNASPKDYTCIFTSGATGALKLVGEAFPWSQNSCFMYTMENHNSVLGIREYALDKGAKAYAVDSEEPLNDQGIFKSTLTSTKVSKHTMQQRNIGGVLEEKSLDNANNLFAFPSECNFSGVKFSLNLVNTIKEQPERTSKHSPFNEGNWFVLIDAAKGCVTEPPDLSKFPADFVVLSFYKLFGYPTGLGALIARNDSAKLLRKTYFSGGTVSASIADADFVKRREAVDEMFEDGTASFLSIASIQHGFRILRALSTCAMSQHMTSLAMYVRKILSALKHSNGANVCMLYGSQSSKKLGSIITFNLRRPDGTWYGYREVEKLASLSGIQLRTGCFCNPGACAKFLGLSHLDIKSNVEAGHVCWDDKDVIHGRPTGAIRISFGYMSTYEDAKRFIDFVTNYFVSSQSQSGSDCQLTRSTPSINEGHVTSHSAASCYLKSIVVYPIKSCAGFSVDGWPLGSSGLQYDREWVLRSSTGEILTQKKVPNLRLINAIIDLNQDILCVESPHCREGLKINLNSNSYYVGMQEIEMQAQKYEVLIYNDEVNCWFGTAVGRPCTLLRLSKSICNRPVCRNVESKINFANTAEFLLISEASVSDLNKRLSSHVQKGPKEAIQVNSMRFRPNLITYGGEPYAEDGWSTLRIGKLYFRSLGGCNRCQMINLNNETEQQKSKEPLATLASYRRAKGKILFGILLGFDPDDKEAKDSKHWIYVGEEVYPDTESVPFQEHASLPDLVNGFETAASCFNQSTNSAWFEERKGKE